MFPSPATSALRLGRAWFGTSKQSFIGPYRAGHAFAVAYPALSANLDLEYALADGAVLYDCYVLMKEISFRGFGRP